MILRRRPKELGEEGEDGGGCGEEAGDGAGGPGGVGSEERVCAGVVLRAEKVERWRMASGGLGPQG